jgi:hypothetical protein
MNNRVFLFKNNLGQVIPKLLNILLIAVCIILLLRSCQYKKEVADIQKELVSLSEEKQGIEKKYDEQGRELSSVKSIVVDKDRQIQKQLKEIEDLKKLDAKVIFRTKTIFDTTIITLHDTTIISKSDTIHLQKFNHKEKWFNIKGRVLKKELIIDSLSIENQFNVEMGDAKVGMFKREKRVYIRNENPYTNTTDIKSYVLEDKKKWYEKDWWKIVGTAVGTALIVRNL